jgi:hypothetical protein
MRLNEEFIDNDSYPDDGSIFIYKKLDTSNYHLIPIIRRLTDNLNYINMNMNIFIINLIKKVEDELENEIKIFLESLTPIFVSMREVEDNYSKVLSRNVKSAMGNPNRVIPDMYIQHFKDK